MARRRRGRGQNNVEKRAARPSPHIRSRQEPVPPVLMQLRPRPLDLHGRMTALSKPNGALWLGMSSGGCARLWKPPHRHFSAHSQQELDVMRGTHSPSIVRDQSWDHRCVSGRNQCM